MKQSILLFIVDQKYQHQQHKIQQYKQTKMKDHLKVSNQQKLAIVEAAR